MLKIVSWNIHQQPYWEHLEGADIALLQECPAGSPAGWTVHPEADDWATGASPWRTAVAIRDGLPHDNMCLPLADLHAAKAGDIGVSRSGTITAVQCDVGLERPVVLASVYSRWEGGGPIYADANAHRILSDLSSLLTSTRPPCDLVVAGDWNIMFGTAEEGLPFWKARYDTVFQRAQALGLSYLGPQHPNGRQASPWPQELPTDSRNVPTYRSRTQTVETAARQLDHVFATHQIADRVRVSARNKPDAWGPSDHCRIDISLDTS